LFLRCKRLFFIKRSSISYKIAKVISLSRDAFEKLNISSCRYVVDVISSLYVSQLEKIIKAEA
ncbi:MAG: hypothetical protein M3Z67_06765, partial [Commensalibacter sp.]|nr:hypothetical protein [Commensalibacter sp.]